MSQPPSPSAAGTGRMTGPVLGLMVFVCVTLIGFSGYLKYELDRAEMALAAPENALAPDQEAFDKLSRALGYSGFVGSAQTVIAGDHAAVADMKAQAKLAQDIVTRLPEKTAPEVRHDLQAIVQTFSAAAHKADQSPGSFSMTDMAPLYAALPVLDARVASAIAGNRVGAEARVKLWATLLTLVAWCSLILAAACTAGIYLALRGRHAAPLRALAQSVQNMARGDMRTPVWGLERRDSVGELARAVDLARYHFSQLPDMSLLSDQGPVRIRFEGNARSLFEAMMQHITRDSEEVRKQALNLTEAINQQKQSISEVAGRVEKALGEIHEYREGGQRQMEELLHTVSASARELHAVQENTSVQLNHLVPYLQERVHGLTEMTQLTGKQVAQTLQSLTVTERHLRTSAEQSEQNVQKLTTSANEVGERLVSAVSLLRAGGKVLTETAEASQSRLNEAINVLYQSEASLRELAERKPGSATEEAASAKRLESIAIWLESVQSKLLEVLSRAEAVQAEKANITAALEKLSASFEGRATQNLENLTSSAARFDAAAEHLARLEELTGSLNATLGELNKIKAASRPEALAAVPDNLLLEIKTGFEITARSIERLREEFVNAALKQPAPAVASGQMTDDQWIRLAAQMTSAHENLAQTLMQNIEKLEKRISAADRLPAANGPSSNEDTQSELQQQTQILSELAGALAAIDTHMQEMEAMFRTLTGKPAEARMVS